MEKVKIISESSPDEFEEKINDFFKDHPNIIKSQMKTHFAATETDYFFVAVILYD